jgi:hypothetical protein
MGGPVLTAATSHLIALHGGELLNLVAEPERIRELKAHSCEWPSWDLAGRQVCDLELLMSGGFSPLKVSTSPFKLTFTPADRAGHAFFFLSAATRYYPYGGLVLR